MRTLSLLILCWGLGMPQILPAQTALWLVDPLEAIYPDRNQVESFSQDYQADIPLGAYAEVHLLVQAPYQDVFKVKASLGSQKLPLEYWSCLIAVPVEQNTGLDSRTQVFTNQRNPYVVRKAPFDIFEAIQPLEKTKIKAEQNYTALRLSVPSSYFKSPGQHEIKIQVKGKGWSHAASFTVNLHDVKVPDLAAGKFFYTNWFNLSRMEEQHRLERWSEDWFVMLRRYAQLMAHGRQNCVIIPHELIVYENDTFSLDADKMLRYIEVFRQEGLRYFETPHLMYRGDDDDWGTEELKVVLTKRGFYSPEGKADVEQLIGLIKAFAEKNDLTENFLFHIQDEPSAKQAKCYREIADLVRSLYPEALIMDATNNRDGLIGAVDLWCPLINDFQENQAFFAERVAAGDKVLVYTCLIPGGQWLNRTLDMERLRQVYFGWGAAHYGNFGYLHWGLNQYQANPFTHSVVQHPSPVAGVNNFLPAGDTHIIYPGEKGPLSSLRFESHRLGVEDFELLDLLKKKDPEQAKKLIGELFRSYTDYELSVAKYRKVKRALLEALAD